MRNTITRALCIALAVLLLGVCAMAESTNVVNVQLLYDTIAADSDAVRIEGTKVTVLAPGIYHFTGALADGQIVVYSTYDGDVRLALDGVNIHCEQNPAILVSQTKGDTIIDLTPGAENALSGGKTYILEDGEEPDGVIFSRDDLEITGGGTLTVTANYRDGIVSKDDLVIENAQITVKAVHNGIRGKDSLEIENSTIAVDAGNDGVKSTNKKDAARGYVSLKDSTLEIRCADDPISAITRIDIDQCAIHVILAEDD